MEYQPLDSAKSEIRLLYFLDPENDGNPTNLAILLGVS
jgi:hypothetical protein